MRQMQENLARRLDTITDALAAVARKAEARGDEEIALIAARQHIRYSRALSYILERLER